MWIHRVSGQTGVTVAATHNDEIRALVLFSQTLPGSAGLPRGIRFRNFRVKPGTQASRLRHAGRTGRIAVHNQKNADRTSQAKRAECSPAPDLAGRPAAARAIFAHNEGIRIHCRETIGLPKKWTLL